jgi:hypothetical protein
MGPEVYESYEEAAQEYLARFRALRETPPAPRAVTARGAGEVAVDTLIEQADQIADVSVSMVPLAKGYLNAPDPALREGISGQLLAQAAAELQVATELLHIAAGETGGPETPVTRAARGASLRDAIDGMEKAMAMPVSAGLIAPGMARRGAIAADTPEEAEKALLKATAVTAGAISQRVVEVGGDLAFNLVFKTEWTAVIQSAGLLNKDIAKLLDSVKEGASALMQRATTAATKTIFNVYDKILALLGKDVEDEARKRVKGWLDEIQKAGKIDPFEQLVGKLYQVDALEAALLGWLEKTTANLDRINATTTDVASLSDKFTVLVGRINTVGDVLGLAKFFQAQFPQVLVVVTALRVALLAVLVYAGYDYIGYKQPQFLNLTKGVGEVIQDNLGIAA